MMRFVCPRCGFIVLQPDSATGHRFNCPSCGQMLEVAAAANNGVQETRTSSPQKRAPLPPALPPPAPPPIIPPSIQPPDVASLPAVPVERELSAPVPPPLPKPAKSGRPARLISTYEDEDEDFPSIERRFSYRGRFTAQSAAKAASTGLACALLSLGLLVIAFVLWVAMVQALQAGFGPRDGDPLVVIVLLVVLCAITLAILGIVFSNRGLDPINTHNRGHAMGGLVCGIISLVIGTILALIFICMGAIFWSVVGAW